MLGSLSLNQADMYTLCHSRDLIQGYPQLDLCTSHVRISTRCSLKVNIHATYIRSYFYHDGISEVSEERRRISN